MKLRLTTFPSRWKNLQLTTHSAGASFSADKECRVRIKLRVEEVDENAPPTGQEEKEREEEEEVVGNDPRSAQTLVALEVIAALCECPAGIKGGVLPRRHGAVFR